MSEELHQNEIKAIKLLQDRSNAIEETHSQIGSELQLLREQLAMLGAEEVIQQEEFIQKKQAYLDSMDSEQSLPEVNPSTIYSEAEARYREPLGLDEILSAQDWKNLEKRLDLRIQDFNHRYGLDGWDYAIAGSCGLFAALIDLLCVKAPPKPTLAWSKEIDGIINQRVQEAFNSLLPPEVSNVLSKLNAIGAPDTSVVTDLLGGPSKVVNPTNHRLRSLAHDPILGFIFGAVDMINGTCTVVSNGTITSIPSIKGTTDSTVFQLLGRMFGHLLSDVNAPSAMGNRGMGLPAPFMGLLRLFEGINVGDSNLSKQIEWMYINGYDFRQFVSASIPMSILEVLLRVFYLVKQTNVHSAPFGETLLDTMPSRINPRFRMMLALAYGTCSAVNAGKVYLTQDILNANYASWMGLLWNGFYALKWALVDKHFKLWSEIEASEIAELENLVDSLDTLSKRARHLPT